MQALIYEITNFFSFPKVEGHTENAKLSWLVRLRWGAIALFFILAGPGYIFEALNQSTILIFIGIVAFLLIFNLLTLLIFVEGKVQVSPLFIGFQLALDSTVLTSLLFISGSFSNPFVGLFLLNAALGGVLIRGRNSWPFVILCHAFLILLQIKSAADQFNFQAKNFWIFVFSSHVLVFSVWIVMRSLGSYLESHFEHLSRSRIQIEKQDRLRALGALSAGFSHEFASPLNAAKLRLDRLEREFDNIESHDHWKNSAKENLIEAKKSIMVCESVIRSMNSSQLDIRAYDLKLVNMKDFISDVVESWQDQHEQVDLVVENHIADSILISPINLAQVILNLLDNAFEANPKGQIKLALHKSYEGVELKVEDHGSGFTDYILSRKGEPFITTKLNGTGLGLYVSELFVQSLGGHLSLKNKTQSSGAIVTLSWPKQVIDQNGKMS